MKRVKELIDGVSFSEPSLEIFYTGAPHIVLPVGAKDIKEHILPVGNIIWKVLNDLGNS